MFAEYLETTLTLTIAGTAHKIPGGQVRAIELSMTSYGFSGSVEFVLSDDKAHGGKDEDKLLADFQKPDLAEIALSVEAVFEEEGGTPPDPVALAGIVTGRSVEEQVDPEHRDRPILWRRYRVEFADPALALWSQHHPCVLYTTKSLKDVFDDHKGSKITLTYDWEALTTAQPIVYLNLVPENGATFYDFVHWYADTRAGVFAYDYKAGGYALRAAKDASGTAVQLVGDDLARLSVTFPEPPRHKVNVLNSYTVAPATKPVDNAQGLDALRHDYLVETPIDKEVEDRTTRETSRLILRKSELRIAFKRWPLVTFQPGASISFLAANLWPKNGLQIGTTWRVRRHEIRARAQDRGPDADQDIQKAMFDVEVRAVLEQKDEAWVERPRYVRPLWPGHLEGTVVSEQGEGDELPYQYFTDKDTSVETYEVKVPLFEDKIVNAPYHPHQGSGKMYVPLHKTARVLLAMSFDRAAIVRLLDWRDGARMAMDAQGERLFFGKKIAANTTVDHVYDDDKPVFTVARINAKDKGTITISEGSLVIQVKEDA